MNDLGLIAAAAGLHDGLNPCIFMTCAVFIVQDHWLRSKSIRAGVPNFIFSFFYALGFLIFTFTPAQLLLLRHDVASATRLLYFVLGLVALGLGGWFFKDWILIRRGVLRNSTVEGPGPSPSENRNVYLGATVLAVIFSALATYWPIDKYMTILGTEGFLRTPMLVMPMLIVYVLVAMWPLWLVWAFVSIKNLRPSLLKIVDSGIFFTASSCMILMFR